MISTHDNYEKILVIQERLDALESKKSPSKAVRELMKKIMYELGSHSIQFTKHIELDEELYNLLQAVESEINISHKGGKQ